MQRSAQWLSKRISTELEERACERTVRREAAGESFGEKGEGRVHHTGRRKGEASCLAGGEEI